jgi:hypothetical protein
MMVMRSGGRRVEIDDATMAIGIDPERRRVVCVIDTGLGEYTMSLTRESAKRFAWQLVQAVEDVGSVASGAKPKRRRKGGA